MADPEHVSLAKSGPSAIARWREATWRRPNTEVPRYELGYRLEDRSAGETFTPDYVYGRPSLDLSGAMLSAAKLPGADLAHDDLSGADLTGSDLHQADLSGANLQGAHLWRSNLSRAVFNDANMAGCTLGRTNLSNSVLKAADLKGADISFSNLSYADLEKADLSGTDLSQTDLSWANLSGANLRNARLVGANLDMADLTGADLQGATIINTRLNSANLSQAVCGLTIIANCDLTRVIGLDDVRHAGPSMISLDTLSRSKGQVPARFLEGAGVAPLLVTAQDAFRESGMTYTRVLLLGSGNDGEFAAKLRASLAEAQVPCWIIAADDEASLRSGETNLDDAVYYDRLVLLCTAESLENPLTSRYFASLVNGRGLSPGGSMGEPLIAVAADEVFYQREDRLCSGLREGVVVDFRGWEDEARYEEALSALVKEFTGPAS
ncbi:MAG: toll/interleukin-1 receptor domain-containing protein [Chloroflexi bacterium]|nr:toll/interleukin-1 receptor domain-containing protein [Chloroflexota bacterium]